MNSRDEMINDCYAIHLFLLFT